MPSLVPVWLIAAFWILVFVWAILWFFVPFYISGINHKLKKLVKLAEEEWRDRQSGRAPEDE